MVATYPADSRQYRAVIESVAEEEEVEGRRLLVRFLDYGNTCWLAGAGQLLFPWHADLELVPPQAVCCRLRLGRLQYKSKEIKELIQQPLSPDSPAAEQFSALMQAAGPLQLTVREVLLPRGHVFGRPGSGPEVVVDLHTSSGDSILKHCQRYVKAEHCHCGH